MMNQIILIFICLLVCFWTSFATDIVVLNSNNFEHLTQASTGATTGDWLIKFYAPWCGHCKTLIPIWEEVAVTLKETVNVAEVDVIGSRDLGTRFDIKGFPTIKFLSKGDVYTYKGKRTAADLVKFATGGYADSSKEIIPPPTTWYNEIIQVYTSAWKTAQVNVKDKKYFTIEIFVVFVPFLFIFAMFFIMLLPAAPTYESHAIGETVADKKAN